MITGKLALSYTVFKKHLCYTNRVPQRNVQVCVVGAASEIGKNVSMLLKQNEKISSLHLYDDDERVKGIGIELDQIPIGPSVKPFSGDTFMPAAVRYSDIVVLVSRLPRKPGFTRKQMLASNVPAVHKLCHTISNQNPDAFLAISTNPINSVIPFASALLYKYNAYNPHKVFGITHIDTARVRSLTAKVLNVNPRHLYIPVIGGHSDETILPLFSNITPSHYSVDYCQADTLTRLVRKAGAEIINLKQGIDSAILTVAWAIYEFIEKLVEAIYYGGYVMVNSYTSNPRFGTRFFSGPTKVGPYGIIESCGNLSLSDYEQKALGIALTKINEEVAYGEEQARTVENVRNSF